MFQIFVPVRTNSNRLPEKQLRQFSNGKTMLENLISEIRLITDAQINLIAPNGQTIFEECDDLDRSARDRAPQTEPVSKST